MAINVQLYNAKFPDLGVAPRGVVLEFINTAGISLRFRCLGVYEDSNFVGDMAAGETLRVTNVGVGERLVAAWDSITKELIFARRYNVENGGRVRIDNALTVADGDAPEAAEVFAPVDLLRVYELEPLP